MLISVQNRIHVSLGHNFVVLLFIDKQKVALYTIDVVNWVYRRQSQTAEPSRTRHIEVPGMLLYMYLKMQSITVYGKRQ